MSCCDHSHSSSGVCQTLDEMEFERGIWYAAQYGDLEKVEKLVHRGVDVRDKSGYTALHYAARNGHVEVCKLLLQNGASVNAATKNGCATALHRAASAGKVEVVELLLKRGADLTLKDSDEKTVLHRAVESRNAKICLEILKRAPSLKDEPDKKGNRPVDYASSPELVSLFQD